MYRRSWVQFLLGTQIFSLSHASVMLISSLSQKKNSLFPQAQDKLSLYLPAAPPVFENVVALLLCQQGKSPINIMRILCLLETFISGKTIRQTI